MANSTDSFANLLTGLQEEMDVDREYLISFSSTQSLHQNRPLPPSSGQGQSTSSTMSQTESLALERQQFIGSQNFTNSSGQGQHILSTVAQTARPPPVISRQGLTEGTNLTAQYSSRHQGQSTSSTLSRTFEKQGFTGGQTLTVPCSLGQEQHTSCTVKQAVPPPIPPRQGFTGNLNFPIPWWLSGTGQSTFSAGQNGPQPPPPAVQRQNFPNGPNFTTPCSLGQGLNSLSTAENFSTIRPVVHSALPVSIPGSNATQAGILQPITGNQTNKPRGTKGAKRKHYWLEQKRDSSFDDYTSFVANMMRSTKKEGGLNRGSGRRGGRGRGKGNGQGKGEEKGKKEGNGEERGKK